MIIKVKPISAINNKPDTNGLGSISYGFFMSETPISNALYCEFLNAKYNIYKKTYRQYLPEIVPDGNIFRPANKLLSNYPVTNVTYFDAQSFILWLNTLEKKYIYYIPSFNEWYKAAYYDPISKQYSNFPNKINNIVELSTDPTSKYGMNVENILRKKIKNKYFIHNCSFFDIKDMAGNTYEMINAKEQNCILVGSAWNRNRLNAHKDNYGIKKINKKYHNNYIGFRVCKKSTYIQFYISLHNEFGDGWKGDCLSIYDTNYGILRDKLTLQNGYDSGYISCLHYPLTDKLIILEYISNNRLFYENSIKLYNSNKKIIYEYTFKENYTKKIIDLDL